MPTYAFLLYGSEAGWEATPEQWEEGMAKHVAYGKEVDAAGAKIVGGEALERTTSAVTVHAGDEPLVTDGPFAETKEQLGGFYLIEAKDLDQAIALAKRMPDTATVEIRPVVATS